VNYDVRIIGCFSKPNGDVRAKRFWKHWANPFVGKAVNGYITGVNELGRLLIRTSVCKLYGAKSSPYRTNEISLLS
jgi:hypothetical protein